MSQDVDVGEHPRVNSEATAMNPDKAPLVNKLTLVVLSLILVCRAGGFNFQRAGRFRQLFVTEQSTLATGWNGLADAISPTEKARRDQYR
jgi:hypothetical protein